MKFIISRASDSYNGKDKQIEGTEKAEYDGTEAWSINIDSLEQLIDLVKKEGPIIINEVPVVDKNYKYEITIYDYWVE